MATPNERKTDLECKKLQYEIDDLKGWWKKSVFEKVCLALILVGVGFAIDYGLKRFQGRVSYQESLFAKRRESYQAIALKAQIARDRVLYLHSNRGALIGETEADLQWEQTFAQLRGSAHHFASGSTGGSWGDPWSVNDVLDAVAALEEVDRIRKDGALFISQPVDRAIDDFLHQLSQDVGAVLTSAEEKERAEEPDVNEDDTSLHTDARSAVIKAYEQLLEGLRENLRIDDIILG